MVRKQFISVDITHYPYWAGDDMQLTQDGKMIHLNDSDIAMIVSERFNLGHFTFDDLVNALKFFEQSNENNNVALKRK